MPLSAGSRVGPYHIESALGAGGMGEVYRARDLRLKRSVALKMLPERFAGDPDRLARFQREAELLAALNHPNIAAVYGLETSDGVTGIVLELVEGATLADIIARGPIPIDAALPIARQIADALDAAHSRGVVHRDLKPANIKIVADGKVKVLDFGLAKMLTSDDPGSPSISMSPTISVQPASGGLILGTAPYMSPEQARAKPVDSRTDVWAFGCVLYEMLTARGAFAGETVTDVLSAVIGTEPDWNALPPSTTPAIRRVLLRCLQKDPSRRFHHMADVRIEIEEAIAGPSSGQADPVAPRAIGSQRMWWAGWAAAALLAVAAIAPLFTSGTESANLTNTSVARLEISLPDGVELTWGAANVLAISPDGRRLAFVGIENGVRSVYLRNLAARDVRVLEGSAGAVGCFFSPDGAALGIVTNATEIRKVSLSDGLVTTIGTGADVLLGGAWLSDDRIVYVHNGTLWILPAIGGEARQVTTLDAKRHEIAHLSPVALPNRNAVAFTIRRDDGAAHDIGLVHLDSGSRNILVERAAAPIYVETGHLAFLRDGSLLAGRFDAERLALSGSLTRLEERIPGVGEASVAVSRTGSLIYSTASADAHRLVWVSRAGHERPLNDTLRQYGRSRISPDGRYLVTEIGGELWVQDLARNTFARVSSGEFAAYPVWTPDGSRLVYGSGSGIRWLSVRGDGRSGTIPGTSGDMDFPTSISRDGTTLLLMRYGSKSADVYKIAFPAGGVATPLVETPAYEGGAQLSPDRVWIAYVSEESGRPQVYVRPFTGPDGKWQVSTSGGTQPVWSGTGKELFYREGDKLMAVQVSGGVEPSLSQPMMLFHQRYVFGNNISIPNYDVTSDGQQFAMIKRGPATNQLKVVLNVLEELMARLP
jgi:Tol biopolymer transport system component